MSNPIKLRQLETVNSGSIIFANSYGILTHNNSQLFWDSTNDRLGIGTSTPTKSIQIGPSSGLGQMQINGGGGFDETLSIQAHKVSGIVYSFYNKDYTRFFARYGQDGTGAGTNASVSLMDGALTAYHYNNTNYRIGFGSNHYSGDAVALGSRQDISSLGTDALFGWNNTLSYIEINSDKGNTYANPYLIMVTAGGASGAVKLSSYGDSYFTGGNVGIGTANPGVKLHVVSSGYDAQIAVSSTGGGAYVTINDDGSGTTFKLGNEGGTGGIMFPNTTYNFFGTGFAGALMFTKINATTGNWTFAEKGNVFSSNTTAKVNIYGTTNDESASALIVGGSDQVTDFIINNAGSVGIGTGTPASKLDLASDNGYEQLRMRTSYTPTNNADTNGNPGDVAWDENYFYMKTAGSGWGRIAWDFGF